ncbi:MAG: substrate-binding domain-containing protein [Spirochaetales bacterium]|nr:substrate-binding domain-containing protein [Spirochaetales bacterium]HNQ96967.1 substrate-binding domain-containing protein [Treponemataceae bacterium]
MAVSIRDVAKVASVSCESILEALISPSSLEPEVVRFVMQTIRTSGFLETFSHWKKGEQRSAIAVAVPSLESPYYVEIFRGIDRALSSLGLKTATIVFPTRNSPVFLEEVLFSTLHNPVVSAVIVISQSPSLGIVEKFEAEKKPLILLQSTAQGAQSVLLENQKGMSIAVNHLFHKGKQRIALINTPTSGRDSTSVASERLMGYVTALHRNALDFDENLVFEAADWDGNDGIAAFDYFSSFESMPDAVICASGDMNAMGFINAARSASLRIPEDIAVMGYGDLKIASLMHPPLTTIRQRLMIAGAGALVLALESCINGRGENLIIMPELVERETV